MDISDVQKMTDEYGEGWAGPHARRLLKLIDQIDAGLSYDREALVYAVWLHDWGAFPRFRQAGVEHGLRSRQVAETDILPHVQITDQQKIIILDAIEVHDYRSVLPAGSLEAVLLREADFLDFLGAIGVAREFAWGPNQLKKSSRAFNPAGIVFAVGSQSRRRRLSPKSGWRAWKKSWNGSIRRVLGKCSGRLLGKV